MITFRLKAMPSSGSYWRWVWDFLTMGFIIFFTFSTPWVECAMTRKQLINSMDMMRSACAPKFKVSTEMLDNLRGGVFAEDRELKCYTMCIAQMAGTMNKKGEINVQKAIAQMDAMLPPDMKEKAKEAILSCREVQGRYKDSCDKTFYSTKCLAEYDPEVFLFP